VAEKRSGTLRAADGQANAIHLAAVWGEVPLTAFTVPLYLNLLGGFELRTGEDVIPIPVGFQRLVIFLALSGRLLPRTHVAGMLWPDVPTGRANANLRAALWRLPPACERFIEVSARHLRLAGEVFVDLQRATALARRLLDQSSRWDDDELATASTSLSHDLLPDWYDDDWVLAERERFHHLRLHALEALCDRLTAAGHYGQAVDAGLAAVRAEPLRESAHRVLIKAHLTEGNHGEASRQYSSYRLLTLAELGIEPSANLRELLLQGAATTR
jgi:DNA-binding SARP family transcriptional activator